jgi:hypothetical protein
MMDQIEILLQHDLLKLQRVDLGFIIEIVVEHQNKINQISLLILLKNILITKKLEKFHLT